MTKTGELPVAKMKASKEDATPQLVTSDDDRTITDPKEAKSRAGRWVAWTREVASRQREIIQVMESALTRTAANRLWNGRGKYGAV